MIKGMRLNCNKIKLVSIKNSKNKSAKFSTLQWLKKHGSFVIEKIGLKKHDIKLLQND